MQLVNSLRPRTLDKFFGNKGITEIIKQNLENGTFPQLTIFSGAQGTGKSSLAELIGLILTCENRVGYNPCFQCDSCQSTLKSGFNSVTVKKFNMGELCSKKEVTDIAKEIFNFENIKESAVYVLEEMHVVPPQSQTTFLEYFTKIPDNVYVFICTNQVYSLIPALINRCTKIELQTPSIYECMELMFDVEDTTGIHVQNDSTRKKIIRKSDCNPRAIVNFFELFRGIGKIEESDVNTYFNLHDEHVDYIWMSIMDSELSMQDFAKVLNKYLEEGELISTFQSLQTRSIEYFLENESVIDGTSLSKTAKGKVKNLIQGSHGAYREVLNVLKEGGKGLDNEAVVNLLMRCKLAVLLKTTTEAGRRSEAAAVNKEPQSVINGKSTQYFSSLGLSK